MDYIYLKYNCLNVLNKYRYMYILFIIYIKSIYIFKNVSKELNFFSNE